jgi:hypothetical protein
MNDVPETIPEMKEKLIIEPARSDCPGAIYRHNGYTISHSNPLIKTGNGYYGSKDSLPDWYRMSTAGEELAIQMALERSLKDPRKAEVFNDLFSSEDGIERRYICQFTETAFRLPKFYKPDKFETDTQGRKYWPRIVLIGDQEVGEVLVPEGNWSAVVEWDPVFGIPKITSDDKKYLRYEKHTTHWWFHSGRGRKDPISGEWDLAITRWSDYCDREGKKHKCISVSAIYQRNDNLETSGFRPVQGSLPEIEREFTRINPSHSDIEEALLEKMRKDIKWMPIDQFREKYKI